MSTLIACGHCHEAHATVAQVRLCAKRDWDRRSAEFAAREEAMCEHGMSAELCAGPNHYPADDHYAPLATMADAHREWHLNAGVPMGQPGCPQDACHLPED